MSNGRDISSDGTTSPRIASVLAINGGSSSVKFAIHETGTSPAVSLRGRVERIGQTGTTLSWSGPDGRWETGRVDVLDHFDFPDSLWGRFCLWLFLSYLNGRQALYDH